jgi:hypothetical protein
VSRPPRRAPRTRSSSALSFVRVARIVVRAARLEAPSSPIEVLSSLTEAFSARTEDRAERPEGNDARREIPSAFSLGREESLSSRAARLERNAARLSDFSEVPRSSSLPLPRSSEISPVPTPPLSTIAASSKDLAAAQTPALTRSHGAVAFPRSGWGVSGGAPALPLTAPSPPTRACARSPRGAPSAQGRSRAAVRPCARRS